MKKLSVIFLAMTLLFALAACGKTDATPPPQPDASESEAGVSIPNPVKVVSQEELAEQSGIALKAPTGAADVVYSTIETGNDYSMAQVSFTYNEKPFTYRAEVSGELEAYDMTGLYYTWTEEADVKVSYCPAKLMLCNEAAGLYWMDVVPGVNYSLGCSAQSDAEEMLEVASLVFESLQGDADGDAAPAS